MFLVLLLDQKTPNPQSYTRLTNRHYKISVSSREGKIVRIPQKSYYVIRAGWIWPFRGGCKVNWQAVHSPTAFLGTKTFKMPDFVSHTPVILIVTL